MLFTVVYSTCRKWPLLCRYYYYSTSRLTSFFQDNLGKPAPER